MEIAFKKFLAQILFWVYDFIDTIGAIFNILTGVETVNGNRQTLLEVFVQSAVSTKVLLGLCLVAVVIAGVSVGVKTVKNIFQLKAGGEAVSHATTVKQGFLAVLSSVACIFFVTLFIAFMSMLLNMVNTIIAPEQHTTLSQNLFELSVEQSYVIDEDRWESREIEKQKEDPNSSDGLAWDSDEKPIMEVEYECYHPYKKDANGELIMETGWVNGHTSTDINWAMSPDEVFGKYNTVLGLFEDPGKGYQQKPMVRLEAFNLLTAYLVAIVMLISMFMLSIGLVKRIYDVIVLIICMPLVCGTIPLDDGARFRAWRETILSKIVVAFGAVIALNVFYMLGAYIMGAGFNEICTYLVENAGFNATTVSIFRMLLLLGGAMCINASQTLIARIMGTSADESREAMQSFAMITSGVRLGAVGALGAARAAAAAGRVAFGGTNRYGRERTGVFNYGARGINAIGERVGGTNYIDSRGGAFMRKLGRMPTSMNYGGSGRTYQSASRGSGVSMPTSPATISAPGTATSNSMFTSSNRGVNNTRPSSLSSPATSTTAVNTSSLSHYSTGGTAASPSPKTSATTPPVTSSAKTSGASASGAFAKTSSDSISTPGAATKHAETPSRSVTRSASSPSGSTSVNNVTNTTATVGKSQEITRNKSLGTTNGGSSDTNKSGAYKNTKKK